MFSDSITCSVITITPGNELYSIFGHTAIRIKDNIRGIDNIYNYGTFNFESEGFYIKFLRGNLEYFLSRQLYSDVQKVAFLEKRCILEQKLNLSASGVETLFKHLENIIVSGTNTYTYRFFRKNCCTMVRDLLNEQFHENLTLNFDAVDNNDTFRQLLQPYFKNKPLIGLGINIILAYKADAIAAPADYLFLPDYFIPVLDASVIKSEDNTIHHFSDETELLDDFTEKPNNTPPYDKILLLIIFASGLIISIAELKTKSYFRYFDLLLYCSLTLTGFLLLLLWIFSEHEELRANFNLLWANPLYLFVLINIFFPSKKKARILVVAAITLLLMACLLCRSMIPQEFPAFITPFLSIVLLRNILLIFDKKRLLASD